MDSRPELPQVGPERWFTLRRPDGQTLSYGVVGPACDDPNGPDRRPAVLLVHGLASNCTRWSEFVEQTSLRQTHRLIRLDLRGHGSAITRRPLHLERWCDDLCAVLDDCGEQHAIVVGHSLGAQVALHLATHYPARVAGLVLIDPVLRTALRGRWRRLAQAHSLLAVAATIVRAANAVGLYRRHLPALDLRELDRQARLALRSPAAEQAFIRRYRSTRADLRHVPLAVYLQDLVEMFRPAPAPQSLRQPVLALLSTSATFSDPGQTAQWLGAAPALELRSIDCHHWPLTERPREVRVAIEEWCARLPTGPGTPFAMNPTAG